MKFFIYIICFFSFQFVYWSSWDILDTCSYKWKFDQCVEANKSWNPRSIEDFICISSNDKYEILPQIILDEEFKKIDKQVESYITKLETNKNEFFWEWASRSLVEWIDEIESKFSKSDDESFWKKYMDFCWIQIVTKTVECFWSTPSIDIKDYFDEDKDQSCKALVSTKLEVFKSVSYDVLKLNKSQVAKDEKKKNTQKRREKYDKLLEIIMVNVWYMERIWKKWPSKTKNTYN